MRITLGPNESKPVTVAGGQFYLLSAFSKVAVKIVSGGDSRVFELSQGMGFKARDGERFFGVEIKDLGGVGQTIDFEISDREVFDNRTVGVVEVINSDRNRTDRGGAFCVASNRAAAAGVFSCVNLRNPSGSGVYVYLNQIIASVNELSDCLIYLTPTIDADQLTAGVSNLSKGAPGLAVKKNVDLMASSGVAAVDTWTADGMAKGNMRAITRTYIAANDRFIFRNTEPIRLAPGAGVVVVNYSLNKFISASFEFFEELVV